MACWLHDSIYLTIQDTPANGWSERWLLGVGRRGKGGRDAPPPELSSVLYLDPSSGYTNASYAELHQALHLKPMAWTHWVNKDF